jgi:hypothetical protein
MSESTPAPQQEMLNINGKSYVMSALPPEIHEYVNIYRQWETQHAVEKMAAFKTEAALKAVSTEIQNRLNAYEAAALQAVADAKTEAVAEVVEEAKPAKSKLKSVKK